MVRMRTTKSGMLLPPKTGAGKATRDAYKKIFFGKPKQTKRSKENQEILKNLNKAKPLTSLSNVSLKSLRTEQLRLNKELQLLHRNKGNNKAMLEIAKRMAQVQAKINEKKK